MAKTSFAASKRGAAAQAADAPPAESTAPVAEQQLAKTPDKTVAAALPPVDDMRGEFNPDDIRWPRVNLVHKTSKPETVDKFGIASFILNQEVKLSDGTAPIEVIAVQFIKDYIQKLPFGDVEKPKTCKTEQEVIDVGGSLRYEDVDTGNYFMPRGHIQLLIPMPAGVKGADESLFPYEHNGVSYAMAILTVSSSAYTSAGKELATLRANNKVMRKGLRYGKLLLTSEGRKSAKFSWVVPVLKFNGENDAKLVEFIESL